MFTFFVPHFILCLFLEQGVEFIFVLGHINYFHIFCIIIYTKIIK